MSLETTSNPKVALFIVPSFSGGGAERCALEVLKNLDSTKYSRHLLPFQRQGEYSDELHQDLVVSGPGRQGRIHAFLPRSIRKWVLSALEIAKVARRLQPDVVVTFLPEAGLPTSLVRWLRLAPPFLWVISEQNATRRRVRETNPSWWRRWIQDHWIGRAYRAADHVIAVSEGVKQGLIDDYALEAERLTVIFNPVDIQRVQTAADQAPPVEWSGKELVVAMGRLTRQKGFDVLLHAFSLIRTARPASLLILGVGEERGCLEDMARNLEITDNVHLVGFKSNPWSYLRSADVFVLSSRWEGCPLVIGEAMACETPVVATDCDYGPGELITNCSNGLLVPTENPQALANAVLEVLSEPEKGERLARAGLVRAKELDISVICVQYDRLICDLLGTD